MATAHQELPLAGLCADRGTTVNASLLAICQAMASSLELRSVLQTILRLTIQEMQAQEGSILLFNEHQDRLEMLASIGLPEAIARQGYLPRKGSIAEWVIAQNKPLILKDRAKGSDFQGVDEKRRIISAMCVPLRARGRVLGTININRTRPTLEPFADEDLDVMEILASQAAICIENSRLHETNLKSERLAAIGQTVAGISHCIKNILTGIRGGISLVDMARGNQDWTLHGQGMDILRRNIDRMSTIVLDMLDYSKERTPVMDNVNLGSLVQEVMATVQSKAEEKRIRQEVEIAPEAATIRGDGQQLFRCVLNLAHNALDATPAGGSVGYSAERSSHPAALRRLKREAAGAVVIRVRDSGPGIDEEHRGVLFEPFFSTKGSKGTGLGLAVTRKIIEEHGGHIEVESRPGESAVFAIYLPAQIDPSRQTNF